MVLNRRLGDPTRTRTPNLLIRSQLLYPVELWDLASDRGGTGRLGLAGSCKNHPLGSRVY